MVKKLKKMLFGILPLAFMLSSCNFSSKTSDRVYEKNFNRNYQIDETRFTIDYPSIDWWSGEYYNNLILKEKGIKYNFTFPKDFSRASYDGRFDKYAKIFTLKEGENENFYKYIEKRKNFFTKDSSIISYLTSIDFKKTSYNMNNNPGLFYFLKERAENVFEEIYCLDSMDFAEKIRQANLDNVAQRKEELEEVQKFLSN